MNVDIDSQIQKYLDRVENNAESAEIYASLSSLYAQKEAWQEAIVAAKKAISIDPEFAGAYRNLARIFTKLNETNAAAECWFKAYSLEPTWANAAEFYRLGDLLLQQKQTDRALPCYIKAIKLQPNFADAYWKLGIVLTLKKKYIEAIEAYHKAIELSDRSSELQVKIFTAYDRTLAVNPDTEAADFYKLAYLLRSQNFIEEAISAYQKSLQIDPFLLTSHSDLSYTNIPKTCLSELVAFYSQIVAKYPYFSVAWSNLGDFLTQQEKITEAIECYQKSTYYQTTNNRPYLVAWNWQKREDDAPDFIIAGATKCGTTSLYRYLDNHPQIIVSRKKEINFFHRYFACGLDWYLSQFPFTDDRSFLTGEASPNYFDFPIAAENMKQLFPKMKIIILLRNPIEKAVSWHYHKFNKGWEKNNYSLREAIEAEIKTLDSFTFRQLCRCPYKYPHNILGSLYYYRLQPWFELFDREQILIIKSEDFYQNTASIMAEVYQFLGLSDREETQYPIWNSGSYTPIDPELRETLAAYFQPHNEKLEEFLGRKFDWK